MKIRAIKTWTAISFLGFTSLSTSAVQAAIVDGQIASVNEYEWNTTMPPNSKWNTRGGTEEVDDGSGGDNWDINYLGTTIGNGEFQVGVTGGSILGGSNTYSGVDLTLGDIAVNVVESGESVTDPATSSAGWDYALRLTSIDSSGDALFSLFSLVDDVGSTVGFWKGSGNNATTGTYDHQQHSYGSTETFRMENGYELATGITGKFTADSGDDNVLETSFDLGLLGLFDEQTGGSVITYITMSCVNDEAIVEAQVSPVPVPAAVWLFGSGLIALVGLGKRQKAA
jgi:hypothetical protein